MDQQYSNNRFFSRMRRLAVWIAYRSVWLPSFPSQVVEAYLREAAEHARITRETRTAAMRTFLTSSISGEDLKKWIFNPVTNPNFYPGKELETAHAIGHDAPNKSPVKPSDATTPTRAVYIPS